MEEFNKKDAYFVTAHRLEALICDQFSFKEYSIIAAEEFLDYQSWDVNINGINDMYAKKDILERKLQWTTRAYLNDMANRGVIPKGLYIIDTNW